MRPAGERTPAGDHFFREELGCAFIRWCVELGTLQNKISKEELSFLLDAPGNRIEEDLIRRSKIVREKFAQPFFTDARNLREQHNQLVVAALDFANLAGHEKRTLLDDAFSSEHTVPAVDKIAAQRPCVDPFCQVIRKANQHAFPKGFGIEFIDFFVNV